MQHVTEQMAEQMAAAGIAPLDEAGAPLQVQELFDLPAKGQGDALPGPMSDVDIVDLVGRRYRYFRRRRCEDA